MSETAAPGAPDVSIAASADENFAHSFAAAPAHKTATSTNTWDAAANEKRLPSPMPLATAKAMYAWIDSGKVKDGEVPKSACKFPHAEVSADGKVGAANVKACQAAIGAVNGARSKPDIPAADRKAVYDHLAAHIKDAGLTPAPFKENLSMEPKTGNELFVMGNDAHFAPQTLDKANRTVDVVWYGGATVPRVDPNTGDKYNLRLSMDGCRLDRLNAGAPFYDNHMGGTDYRSHSAGLAGSKAQLGTVQKAWSDGPKGMATVKFRDEGEDENADNMFNGIASGHFRNLSFGTTINSKKLESTDDNKGDTYVATDWEPYELSQANVPADYTTTFLTAAEIPPPAPINITVAHTPDPQFKGIAESLSQLTTLLTAQADETKRASAQKPKEPSMETTTQAAGDQTRATEEAVAVAVKTALAQANERRVAIRASLAPFKFKETFINEMLDGDLSVDKVREKALLELAADADRFTTRSEVSITRDGKETQLQCMEAALSKRANTQVFAGLQATERRQQEDMAREYVGYSLIEMARASVELTGKSTRGMSKMDIATRALAGDKAINVQTFGMGGAESTSDFPAILANVANKTLRQAYDALPQTFKPFSKPATAVDFKPINRVQLNDLPSLPLLNEKGEYKRVNLNDSNATYSLVTRGGVVAITRKAIINDDLSAFTRTSAALGTAAARTQSDIVWGLITSNAAMADGFNAFSTQHLNYNTGTNTSINASVNTGTNATIFAMAQAKAALRLQKAPNGTPLNLVPKFILAPAALESYVDQLINPMQLAAATVAGVDPQWVTSLIKIIEPRLDAVSVSGWYAVADPSTIDTVEYCFLEGQEGVYYEMRQGFDVDGLEIKARIDFGAQIIEYRGMQLNKGTA